MTEYSPVNSQSQSISTATSAVKSAQAETDISKDLALTAAQAASDRKAGDIVVLRVADVSYMADYFVIATGYSHVQVRAIAQAIADQVEQEWQRQPLRTEGKVDASWMLQDYGDVIVHVMMPKEREFYNLEAFWGHAEQIEFTTADGA
ncbi:ribosome silencing factor [Chroogloeocystis siderophila]|uniref:Ribosomal silencing factor RsfS n=1 Tax=Chroogloeocystis siderophila 5.2 s.c.1 TaxID=247279 RepID=A0A1U7HLY6_9CHRO|nr:ribosome silencing factor [Chroogloeocystis siderophila]OKH24603.1 ribosome silencing factor [Chroogloeocystis siderophila 5.2 s.c.1]